ncbi:MAG: PspC domain-containing protein [Actinobacteria bacterium]|nr:PspC domain-containing protein [Actinomycetota bacterium]
MPAHGIIGEVSGETSVAGGESGRRPAVRLTRRKSDRVLAGVCGGVARALGLDPLVVRVAAVVLTVAGGTGALLYLLAWIMLPAEDEAGEADGRIGAAAAHDSGTDVAQVLAIGSIMLGVLLLVRSTGIWFSDVLVWPVLLAGVGLTVIWRQAGDDDRPSLLRVVDRLPRPGAPTLDLRSRRAALARVVLGVAFVVSGVGAFLAASEAFSAVRQGFLASTGIVAGLALITGPWWLRMGRDLARERRERIRSEERAEVAAHLHDSVLQTLALIQRNAEDPRAVVTMARRQERELRGWLYDPEQEGAVADTLASALQRAGEEVEGMHGVSIDTVAVGDLPLDDRLRALVAAAREGMVNAAKWSGETAVSVYAEVRDRDVSVYVRDWGKGFDLEHVAPDRHGVTESIVERMARQGGTAVVRTAPGEGTEVELRMTAEGR